jgi:hypothetical protein
MRHARLYLPVVICLAVIAVIAFTQGAHELEGLILIGGAASAIVALDRFARRAGGAPGPGPDEPESRVGGPPMPPRR